MRQLRSALTCSGYLLCDWRRYLAVKLFCHCGELIMLNVCLNFSTPEVMIFMGNAGLCSSWLTITTGPGSNIVS